MVQHSYLEQIVQIDELIEELDRKDLDVPKVVKLLRELLEDLVAETTALSCVKIDYLSGTLMQRAEFNELPFELQEIVKECFTLHDYPIERFMHATPQQILKNLDNLYNEMEIDKLGIKTRKTEIVRLFGEGKKAKEIATSLEINIHMVERVLLFAGLISGFSEIPPKEILLSRHRRQELYFGCDWFRINT